MAASRLRAFPALLVPVSAALVAVLAASCGSPPAASGAPSRTDAAAKADCATVGRALGAPPGQERAWARKVESVPDSGIATLDGAVRRLTGTLRGRDSPAAIDHAYATVVAACGHLGLWQAYHAPAQPN